jgi:hypothetical protein
MRPTVVSPGLAFRIVDQAVLITVAATVVGFAAVERRVVVEGRVAEFPRVAAAAAVFGGAAEQAVVSHAGRTGRMAVETDTLHIRRAFRIAKEANSLAPRLAGRRHGTDAAGLRVSPAELGFS